MPQLAVFFETLDGWADVGSLDRSLAIYKRFAEDGWDVSFYINRSSSQLPDLGFACELYSCPSGILSKRLNFLYRWVVGLMHLSLRSQDCVILVNHLYHKTPAFHARRLWRAKVVARCGMVYGESAETLNKGGLRAIKRTLIERAAFRRADRCLVPTKELADWVIANYDLEPDKVVVVPNYVDTNPFSPDPSVQKDNDIICVGRLVPKKRHKVLLEALVGMKVRAHIIGQGGQRQELSDFIEANNLDVTLTPRIENQLLPFYYNRSKVYLNIAQWEGHPKALIEAMACGCACVGAKSPGIENLLIDGQTGLLVEPEPSQIRGVVRRLLEDEELRARLGRNARQYAVEHFSLDKVYQQHKQICEQLLAKG